jgi:hypothetical protein
MCQLSEIDSQPLHTLVCDYLICQSCGVIDRDYGRLRKGNLCDTCGVANDIGRLAFSSNISVLINLLQQTFHSVSPLSSQGVPQGADVGTILFYCTLRESLINNFLLNNLKARSIDAQLIKKLLDDNMLASQKFGSLFFSVVGVKWSDSLTVLNKKTGKNFIEVSELMCDAARIRNKILHEGRVWEIGREFSEKCINSIGNLVDLFVELHNEYTQPIIQNNHK